MDTITGQVHFIGGIALGDEARPPQLTSSDSQMSASAAHPEGSVHMRSDGELPEVKHDSAVKKLGLAENHCIECRLATLTANAANTYTTYMPRDGIITGVSRRYTAKPASTLGTVVTGITVGGTAILNSASESEEGLTNDTLTAHNLTGTPANLVRTQGEKIVITVTSNNADMTDGTGGMYYIYFTQN